MATILCVYQQRSTVRPTVYCDHVAMKFMYRFLPSNESGIWTFHRLVFQYSGKNCKSSDRVLWMNITYSITEFSGNTYSFQRVNGSFEFVESLSAYCEPLSANQEHSISDYVCTGFPENPRLNLTELLSRENESAEFLFSICVDRL